MVRFPPVSVGRIVRPEHGGDNMKLGIHLPHAGEQATPALIRRHAMRAEALGFDDVWVSEHIIVPRKEFPRSPLFYDPVVTLTYVAAVTERVRLGTTVLVLPMRHPLPLAKELASLHNLSNGRLILGAGVHRDAGSTRPTPRRRRTAAGCSTSPGRVDDAIPRIDAALAADETYPDAHFFKGMALFRGKSDAAGAIPQFQRYITLVPDSPLSDQVRGLLAEAVAASNSSSRP